MALPGLLRHAPDEQEPRLLQNSRAHQTYLFLSPLPVRAMGSGIRPDESSNLVGTWNRSEFGRRRYLSLSPLAPPDPIPGETQVLPGDLTENTFFESLIQDERQR